MPLNDTERKTIEAFRKWIENALAGDSRFSAARRVDRDDEATLASQFQAEEAVYFEVAVRPFIPQVRVGVMTDDRWKSEEIEQGIIDSGDTMQEFVELGLEDAGLDWPEPLVEHYRDQGKYFYFATPFEPQTLAELNEPAIREKTRKMLDGYYHAFSAVALGGE